LRRALPALIAVLAVTASGCGEKKEKATASTTPPAATTQTQAAATPGGCKQATAPRPRKAGKQRKPTRALDAHHSWTLAFETNCGEFSVALDLRKAPRATASLVALARSGYFKNTVFHRIVPGFVIQGGDPTATGTGGPGYTTVDPPPRSAAYTRGVVAMAKTQTEPRGAAGSQFYVVTGADAGLPPDYAIVGKVSKGLDTVERIGRLGDASEQPTEPVVISAVRVMEN
jgi:cyclophilin family peptidyl-prolyl cis-trans isomerase